MSSTNERFYQCGGVTIRVTSELPITDHTFSRQVRRFEVAKPGIDTVSLHHAFSLPDVELLKQKSRIVYQKRPWRIYRSAEESSWLYLCETPEPERAWYMIGVFNETHEQGHIFGNKSIFQAYATAEHQSLSLMPTDQILLTRILADRQACIFHSAGVILNGHGLLFIGHSEAGKSTISRMLQQHGTVLSDDRNIVRKDADGFRIYGTWSYSGIDEVSPECAPLRAIYLLKQEPYNRITACNGKKALVNLFLPKVIRSVTDGPWWQQQFSLLESMLDEVPVYTLAFDRSGEIVGVLKESFN